MNGTKKTKVIRATMATAVVAIGGVGFAVFGMPGHGHDGPPQKDLKIGKAEREATVASAIASLDRYYVFPDKARAIGGTLRAKLAHGDYDAITSAEQLAETLTDDLQDASHDKHLEVRYFEQPIPADLPNDELSPEDQAIELREGKHLNFGFESVDRLHGDIGYLNLHSFQRPQMVGERIAATMTLLADTQALVIDLRKCEGGDPDTVMLLASYFYDRRTHLNDIYFREGARTEQRWTQEVVPGRKYGEARKIYLLTSSDTFSACEDFAYALKNNGRATVIGETTGGGAHPGNHHRLAEHFAMNVPSGRSISPVTHTDWEVVGVKPDIETSANKAQDRAELVAIQQLIAVEKDADWKRRLQHRLDDLQ